MPAKTKTRIKAPEIPVPQTLAEAEEVFGRIGRLQRQVEVVQARMNDQLAEIKAAHEAEAAPLVETIETDFVSLQAWAEANRNTLLEGERKSVTVATGELGWRRTPPAVQVRGVDLVIAALKDSELDRFIRTKEEVDKDAIRKEPAAVADIAGISITQQEEFWIRPFGSEIERARARRVSNDPQA